MIHVERVNLCESRVSHTALSTIFVDFFILLSRAVFQHALSLTFKLTGLRTAVELSQLSVQNSTDLSSENVDVRRSCPFSV